jgi:nitrogen fixation protein NifX
MSEAETFTGARAPAPEAPRIPGSIRVACASDHGEELDGHFGSCARYLVYDVSPRSARLVAVRTPAPEPPEGERQGERLAMVADCHVLYVASIGGPAAAKVVNAGVHPVRYPAAGSAPELMERLGLVLATAPPPWLAKIIGIPPEERVRHAL